MSDIATDDPSLRAYIRGYAAKRPEGLQWIAHFGQWSDVAALECERRGARFIEGLPNAELVAIARGEIDLAALARDVAREIRSDDGN